MLPDFFIKLLNLGKNQSFIESLSVEYVRSYHFRFHQL